MSIHVCAVNGSDAVVGGDTTAAQKLARNAAVVGGVATGAFKTHARWCALLTDYANENGGAKYLDITPTDLVVNGPVTGTSANPSLASALANMAGVGTFANIRRWGTSDPLPPGNGLLYVPLHDGAGRLAAGQTGAWAYDAPSTTWSASPLPAAWTAAAVNTILLCPNTLTDKLGRPRHTVRKAAETSIATYKANITAAIAAGTASTYDNTYVIENVGGTTLTICMRITEFGGGVIDSTVNGNRVYLDNNSNDAIAALVTVTASASLGTADNALLCLQYANRPNGEWLTIDQFGWINVGQSAPGKYGLSLENGQRVRVNGYTQEGGGHHGAPGVTGGVAFSDQDTQDIEINDLVSGRSFGASGGSFNVISCVGNNLARIRFNRGVCRYGGVIAPSGNVSSASAGGMGWFLGGSNVYSKPGQDVEVKNYRFTPDPLPGEATINGGVGWKNSSPITAGQEMSGSAYPLRFRECIFDPVCHANFYSYGTRDSTTGGPGAGAAPNDVLSSFAFIDSALNFTGGGGATDGTFGKYGLLNATGNNWTGGAGALPANFPRNILFERCLIVINSGFVNGFANATSFMVGSGKIGVCWRFKNCVIIDINRARRGSTSFLFDYINTGSAGDGYNCGYACHDSLLLNLYDKYSSTLPVRKLFANDSNLEARTEITGATRNTWQDFQRNFYGGFSPTVGFSAKSALDSKAEWLAGVGGGDPAGVAEDSVNLTSEIMQARIRTALGTTFLGGADPMLAVQQSVGNGLISVPQFKTPAVNGAEIYDRGMAIGLVAGRMLKEMMDI